jgi:hypothetical protein
MKMLEVGIAGIDSIMDKLIGALNDAKLLKNILREVNENGNHDYSKDDEDEDE